MEELVTALDAWRAAKSPVLADAIDALSAQVPRAPAPRRDQHEHWMRAALVYDPVRACALIDTAHERVHKGDSAWAVVLERLGDDPIIERILARLRERRVLDVTELPVHQRNRIERLCAFARWPDDPRVATVLARWFARDGFTWSFPHQYGVPVVLDVLAEQLIRIGDVRVVPVVASCIDRPRARTEALRKQQSGLARKIVDVLGPYEAPPAPVLGDRPLWEAVARDPDDLGARMVLADFLIQHGDRRGELISLACADDAKPRAIGDQLLAEHWNDWLGDLALVVKRSETTFDRGTLDKLTLGVEEAPAWAYSALGDHRELLTVRRVARSYRYPSPLHYATFIDRLPDLSRVTLELDADTIVELARLRETWPTRAIHIDISGIVPDRIATAFDQIRRMFPALASIDIRSWSAPDSYLGLVPRLAHVPRIVIHTLRSLIDATIADAAALAMPNLEVVA